MPAARSSPPVTSATLPPLIVAFSKDAASRAESVKAPLSAMSLPLSTETVPALTVRLRLPAIVPLLVSEPEAIATSLPWIRAPVASSESGTAFG